MQEDTNERQLTRFSGLSLSTPKSLRKKEGSTVSLVHAGLSLWTRGFFLSRPGDDTAHLGPHRDQAEGGLGQGPLFIRIWKRTIRNTANSAVLGFLLQDKHEKAGNGTTACSVTSILSQNSSQALPGELKLRGQLRAQTGSLGGQHPCRGGQPGSGWGLHLGPRARPALRQAESHQHLDCSRCWGLPFYWDSRGHFQSTTHSLVAGLVVSVDGRRAASHCSGEEGHGSREGLALGLHHNFSAAGHPAHKAQVE
ncbi:uncharacterized protein LOC130678913 [Manis pentadactyla]|uniref:uncharacterized protein LOC130678913 n=1 Tax=Manis pentadactyla TaxID=143292 RepID=UPI00255C4BEA|nr:uncharacterized protein LOC130678913 [Manis pentadactyla]